MDPEFFSDVMLLMWIWVYK